MGREVTPNKVCPFSQPPANPPPPPPAPSLSLPTMLNSNMALEFLGKHKALVGWKEDTPPCTILEEEWEGEDESPLVSHSNSLSSLQRRRDEVSARDGGGGRGGGVVHGVGSAVAARTAAGSRAGDRTITGYLYNNAGNDNKNSSNATDDDDYTNSGNTSLNSCAGEGFGVGGRGGTKGSPVSDDTGKSGSSASGIFLHETGNSNCDTDAGGGRTLTKPVRRRASWVAPSSSSRQIESQGKTDGSDVRGGTGDDAAAPRTRFSAPGSMSVSGWDRGGGAGGGSSPVPAGAKNSSESVFSLESSYGALSLDSSHGSYSQSGGLVAASGSGSGFVDSGEAGESANSGVPRAPSSPSPPPRAAAEMPVDTVRIVTRPFGRTHHPPMDSSQDGFELGDRSSGEAGGGSGGDSVGGRRGRNSSLGSGDNWSVQQEARNEGATGAVWHGKHMGGPPRGAGAGGVTDGGGGGGGGGGGEIRGGETIVSEASFFGAASQTKQDMNDTCRGLQQEETNGVELEVDNRSSNAAISSGATCAIGPEAGNSRTVHSACSVSSSVHTEDRHGRWNRGEVGGVGGMGGERCDDIDSTPNDDRLTPTAAASAAGCSSDSEEDTISRSPQILPFTGAEISSECHASVIKALRMKYAPLTSPVDEGAEFDSSASTSAGKPGGGGKDDEEDGGSDDNLPPTTEAGAEITAESHASAIQALRIKYTFRPSPTSEDAGSDNSAANALEATTWKEEEEDEEGVGGWRWAQADRMEENSDDSHATAIKTGTEMDSDCHASAIMALRMKYINVTSPADKDNGGSSSASTLATTAVRERTEEVEIEEEAEESSDDSPAAVIKAGTEISAECHASVIKALRIKYTHLATSPMDEGAEGVPSASALAGNTASTKEVREEEQQEEDKSDDSHAAATTPQYARYGAATSTIDENDGENGDDELSFAMLSAAGAGGENSPGPVHMLVEDNAILHPADESAREEDGDAIDSHGRQCWGQDKDNDENRRVCDPNLEEQTMEIVQEQESENDVTVEEDSADRSMDS